jgi:hypothetical protein
MLLTPPFEDETFLEVEERSLPTRAGSCPMPLLYRDSSLLALAFPTDPRRAASLFAGASIEPWTFARRALTILAAFEHRDTSIGPHAEIAVFVPCRLRGRAPSLLRFALDMRAQEDQGAWPGAIAVDTDAAVKASEPWGYARYRTEIDVRFELERTRVETRELAIDAAAPRGPSLHTLPIITYSERGGRLLRTITETEGAARLGTGLGARVELRADGPTAALLRELGLERARPSVVARVDRLRARVPPGADLGPNR